MWYLMMETKKSGEMLLLVYYYGLCICSLITFLQHYSGIFVLKAQQGVLHIRFISPEILFKDPENVWPSQSRPSLLFRLEDTRIMTQNQLMHKSSLRDVTCVLTLLSLGNMFSLYFPYSVAKD